MIPFGNNPAFRAAWSPLQAQAGRRRTGALADLASAQTADRLQYTTSDNQLSLQKYQNRQREGDQFWRFGVSALSGLAR